MSLITTIHNRDRSLVALARSRRGAVPASLPDQTSRASAPETTTTEAEIASRLATHSVVARAVTEVVETTDVKLRMTMTFLLLARAKCTRHSASVCFDFKSGQG